MQAYAEGKLDEVFIVYNHAKNAAEQTLVEQQVLPVKEESYADLLGLKAKEEDIFKSFRERDDSAIPGDIDFEPSTESVMSYMMNAYLNNAFYYAMLDSAAGEQGALPQRDEIGYRQRERDGLHPGAHLQHGAPGRHYHGDHRDRRRCRSFGGLNG